MGRMASLAVVLGGLLVSAPARQLAPARPPPRLGPASASASAPPPATSGSPSAASGASQQPPADDWAAVVEAARREGVVQCACPPRPDYARLIKDKFERANPGIRLEPSPATLPDIWARVEKEQAAGQFLWDVYMFGPTVEMFALKDQGRLRVLPRLYGRARHRDGVRVGGGWDAAFLDREKRYVFAFWRNVTSDLSINRDLLPSGQVNTFDDLLDPAYRGKLVWQDPRSGGIGVSLLTATTTTRAETRSNNCWWTSSRCSCGATGDGRAGRFAAGRRFPSAALSEDTLLQYRQAGVPLNLETADLEDMPSVSNPRPGPGRLQDPAPPQRDEGVRELAAQPAHAGHAGSVSSRTTAPARTCPSRRRRTSPSRACRTSTRRPKRR